jgi:hypothetical protein
LEIASGQAGVLKKDVSGLAGGEPDILARRFNKRMGLAFLHMYIISLEVVRPSYLPVVQ